MDQTDEILAAIAIQKAYFEFLVELGIEPLKAAQSLELVASSLIEHGSAEGVDLSRSAEYVRALAEDVRKLASKNEGLPAIPAPLYQKILGLSDR